jgi:hypothetical protein
MHISRVRLADAQSNIFSIRNPLQPCVFKPTFNVPGGRGLQATPSRALSSNLAVRVCDSLCGGKAQQSQRLMSKSATRLRSLLKDLTFREAEQYVKDTHTFTSPRYGWTLSLLHKQPQSRVLYPVIAHASCEGVRYLQTAQSGDIWLQLRCYGTQFWRPLKHTPLRGI